MTILDRIKRRFSTESAASRGPSIRIPYTAPGAGAKFGEPIRDADITFALKREPVAHRIVFTVAHDVFDNWFTVDDVRTEGPDEGLDRKVQAVLKDLDVKDVFTQMAVFERAYGWAIIVIGYNDGGERLSDPVKKPKEIEDLAAYAPTQITSIKEDKDRDSPRYGLPEEYRLSGFGGARLHVHYSRVIHFATRLLDHRYKGVSVLAPVWDDLTTLRNIRWGMGQTMYRYGSGFPDITLEGASKKQLDDFEASGQMANIHARTYFLHNERQKLEFKGLAGRALDPEKFYLPIMENISAGSNIPLAILRGAQAGALTGSEVNEREYFKLISDAQSRYEPGLRFLINKLIEIGQIKTNVEDYAINWLGGFEINERDKAAAEYDLNRSLVLKTNWMTVNEIRAEQGLESVAGGDVVLGLLRLQTLPFGEREERHREEKRVE